VPCKRRESVSSNLRMASDMKKLWFIKESFVGRVCCDVKFCIEWLFRAVCCYSSS
jgi:hypothetical protein